MTVESHQGATRMRRLQLLFFYATLLAPPILLGASHTLQTNANSPLHWVPQSFGPRAEYEAFVQLFGSGDLVIVGWEGCTIDESRLDELVRLLRQSPRFRDNEDQWLFDRVSCGREVLQQLTADPLSLQPAVAVQRLRGSFIGPDGRSTCVVAALRPGALPLRKQIVSQIEQAIEQTCGVARERLHLAGPVLDGLSVDEASKASLDRLAPPSALLILVLACVSLGSLRGGLIVFGFAIYCQAATLALVHYAGETMNALLIVLPPLIQVLAVAGGIHLTNYYFETLPVCGPDEAPWEAVRMGWLPCLLSLGTTALGIASLMASQLSPIRTFGVFGSAGVLITLGLLLSFVPASLRLWPPRSGHAFRWQRVAGPRPDRRSPWDALAVFLSRHHRAIVAGSLAILAVCSLGLPRITTSVRIETLLGQQSRTLRDYRWLEQQIGPLVPIEVVVSYAAGEQRPLWDRLGRLAEAQAALAHMPEVGTTFSALQLLPSLPAPSNLPPDLFHRAIEQSMLAARPSLIASGRLSEDSARQSWRITGFISALGNTDYGQFLERVRRTIEPALAAGQTTEPSPAVSYTGIMPLVHAIQQQLMRDLLVSFAGALVVITLVMTVAQAGFLAGLVSMIPNLFPIVLLFGLLGWARMPLDIGMVMTASIALGIAVDDTLHYLTFFRRGLVATATPEQAVQYGYRHCGAAMVQSSVVCGAGLLVFALSDFVPTSRFAWLMTGLLAAALAGDLLLLPALLLSPLGRLFASTEGAPSLPVGPPCAVPAAAAVEPLEPHPASPTRPSRIVPRRRYLSNAASTVSPGPKASITQGPRWFARDSRSRMNNTVGDDMLP